MSQCRNIMCAIVNYPHKNSMRNWVQNIYIYGVVFFKHEMSFIALHQIKEKPSYEGGFFATDKRKQEGVFYD